MFKNRIEAGQKLGHLLLPFKNKNSVVLAIPRGGVPIGYEISKKLNIPLDVIITRKIGNPSNRELGVGAISENNSVVLDTQIINELDIPVKDLDQVVRQEKDELQRRIKVYRKDQPLPLLKGKTVILVDDGVARGVTALAAIKAVKKLNPKTLIFACPVCSKESVVEIEKHVDEIICLSVPPDLSSIGEFYEDFTPVDDKTVVTILGGK